MITEKDINMFTEIVGKNNIFTNEEDCYPYGVDATPGFAQKSHPSCVLFVKTTHQVSQVIKYCFENKIAIVPSGGRTGLSAGAVATKKEVVISMEKMNQLLEIDEINSTFTCEAGIVLEQLNTLLEKECGGKVPYDLASRGSCQIGGGIAANTGGSRYFKEGPMHAHVLGVTMVSGTGEIIKLGSKCHKNSTDRHLLGLMIGSEGQYGVITEATMRYSTMLKPADSCTFFLGLPDLDCMMNVIKNIRKSAIDYSFTIEAAEFLELACLESVLKRVIKTDKFPMEEKSPYYLLFEISAEKAFEIAENFVSDLFEQSIISDCILGTSSSENQTLWAYRESIPESLKLAGDVKKFDVSVPLSMIGKGLNGLYELVKEKNVALDLYLFGHLFDGNIHINIMSSVYDYSEFEKVCEEFTFPLYKLIDDLGGLMSAEHGIGQLHQEHLKQIEPKEKLQFRKLIKQVMDPANIFPNPISPIL